MKLTNNHLAGIMLCFILISIIGHTLVFQYLSISGKAIAGQTIVRFCIDPSEDMYFSYPVRGSILNGTETITFYSPIRTNISFILRYGGGLLGEIGRSLYDGDDLYSTVFDTNTPSSPDLNCEYIIGADTEIGCGVTAVTELSINNQDVEPVWDNFKNNWTTNFSKFTAGLPHRKWTSVGNVSIGVPGIGLVLFPNQIINADDADLDSNVNISHNYIMVNTFGLKCFRKTALISIYNLSYINPYIKRQGENCTTCVIQSYQNGTLTFIVSPLLDYDYFSAAENNSARLSIWTTAPDDKYYNDRDIRFSANLTDGFSNQSLHGTNVTCNITINISPDNSTLALMEYHSDEEIYTYSGSKYQQGVHNYTVACDIRIRDMGIISNSSNFTILNRNPYLASIMPNMTWNQDVTLAGINLKHYFIDPDKDALNFSSTFVPEIMITIANGAVSLQPNTGWYGSRTVVFFAHDPYGGWNETNEVTLTVKQVKRQEQAPQPSGDIYESLTACYESWECTSFGPCLFNNIRARTCIDTKSCGTDSNKPSETQSCVYVPTCNDLVQNQNETGVDCGGPCPECTICNYDGIQNEGETGVDCGGPCPACKEKGIEAPTIFFGMERKEVITFSFLLILFITLLLLFIMNAEQVISSLIIWVRIKIPKMHKPVMPSESQVLIESKHVKKFEDIEAHIESISTPQALSAAVEEIRSFIKELLHIDYEFSEDELRSELNRAKISATTKYLLISYLRQVEAIRYGGYKMDKAKLRSFINDGKSIIHIASSEQNQIWELQEKTQKIETMLSQRNQSWFHMQKKDMTGKSISGDRTEVVHHLISSMRNASERGRTEQAKATYQQLSDYYASLPEEEKAAVHQSILDAYTELKNAPAKASRMQHKTRKSTAIVASIVLLSVIIMVLLSYAGVRFTGMVVLDELQQGIQGRATSGNTLSIIDPQSYPAVGENWSIHFVTKGKDALTIKAVDGTIFTYDLAFEGLFCGNNTINATYNGIKIFVPEWECDQIATLRNRALTEGEHHLAILFGSAEEHANNYACNASTRPVINEDNVAGYEGLPYLKYMNVTDPENMTIIFYDIQKSVNENFSILIDNSTGLINFIPVDTDTGVNHSITYKARNNESCEGVLPAYFYVYDRPDITNYEPANLSPEMDENSSLDFNLTSIVNRNPDDILSYYWFIDSILNGTEQNWTYEPDFCDAGAKNITVIVNNSYNLSTSLTWNLTVSNVNRPPVLNKTIANITWSHDTNLTDNFTLEDYFYDLDAIECTGLNKDNLTFNYTPYATSNISILINETSTSVSFMPRRGWAGVEIKQFIASDSIDSTASNEVVLNVTPPTDNHHPVFNEYPADISTNVSTQITLQINASDPDGDDITYDAYSSDFPSLTINSSTGLINFTARRADIGLHSVIVTLTDAWGASNDTTFTIEVNYTPSPPYNIIIPKNHTRIFKNFSMTISATDDDYPEPGDYIDFEINDTSAFIVVPIDNVSTNFSAYSEATGEKNILLTLTDSYGLQTNTTFVFEFTENHAPELWDTNLSANATYQFTYQLNATDYDDDALAFSYELLNNTPSNFAMDSSGLIDFAPLENETGNHTILVNVTDGNLTVSKNITFKVLPINHPPNITIMDLNATENQNFFYEVNATDQDNDTLNFSYSFIGATMPRFSMNNSGVMDFTPNRSDIGRYVINISVSDGMQEVSHAINFTVYWNNTPVQIIEHEPNQSITINEGETKTFNITAFDPDIELGDHLNFTWFLDELKLESELGQITNQSNLNFTQNASIYFSYCTAGNHILIVQVNDSFTMSNYSWNINVININRHPEFGKKYIASSELANGSLENISMTTSGAELSKNGSDYAAFGIADVELNFPPLNPVSNTSYQFVSIVVNSTLPYYTFLETYTRSSEDGSNWSNWSQVTNTSVPSPARERLQVRFNLSTTDSNITPIIHNATISYMIDNLTIKENIDLLWIDLDDYFTDPDKVECGSSADNISYAFAGNVYANMNILANGVVRIAPISEGTDRINFSATDAFNATSKSNNVTITMIHVPPPPQPDRGGGGGGTQTIIKEKIVEKEKPILLKIITPESVTIYENNTVVVPIRLQNNATMILQSIDLTATTENKDIKFSFSNSHFDKLARGEEVKTSLTISSAQSFGNYDVVIKAKVKEPAYEDSTKIMINSIEMGMKGEKEFNTKIAFTRDLLAENQECLELNELIEDAKQKASQGSYSDAISTLDNIIENCKYLMSQKAVPEKQKPFGLNSNLLIGIIISLVLVLIALVFYLVKSTKEPL